MSKFLINGSIVMLILLVGRESKATVVGEADLDKGCFEEFDGDVSVLIGECDFGTHNGVLLSLQDGEMVPGEEETILRSGNLWASTSGFSHAIMRWGIEILPEGAIFITASEHQFAVSTYEDGALILTEREEIVLAPYSTVSFNRDGEVFYRRNAEGDETYYDEGGCSSAPGSKKSQGLLWLVAAMIGLVFTRQRRVRRKMTNG